MTILHIIGKPRQGKGIMMTHLSLGVADAGNPVDTNYNLLSKDGQPMPNVKYIGFYDLLQFLKKPRQEPTHLLNIDELPGWCDSYVSSSKSSRFATHFLNQSAKLGYDMIFSSQRSMRADINFRELSDCRLEATKDTEKKVFRYQPMNPDILDDDVPMGKAILLPFDLAQSFWNRYDTYEAVPPVGLDEVLSDMQKYDPARHNANVDRLVNLLLECWHPQYILDLSTVKDILLEQHQALGDAVLVFSRLRRRMREKREVPIVAAIPNIPQVQHTIESSREGWLRFQKPTN